MSDTRPLIDRHTSSLLAHYAGLVTTATRPTGTESRVCQDIVARQAIGIAKYGTTVESNPLPLKEWLQHAYEECLDQAIYLKRAIEELDKSPNEHRHTPEGR